MNARFPKSARLRRRGEFLRVQDGGRKFPRVRVAADGARSDARGCHRVAQARGSRAAEPRKTPGAGSLPASQVVISGRARRRVHRQEERRRGRIRPGGPGDREAVPKILSATFAALLLAAIALYRWLLSPV